MIMNSFSIKTNTITKNDLISLLNECDNYFTPKLSSQIDNLENYADKIYKNADIIEAYNKNGILAGFLCIYLNRDIGYITHFAVKPEFQHHGIGFKLLEAAESLALKRNIDIIRLECFKINKQGLNFYKKQFFKKIKEENDKITFEKLLKNKNNTQLSIVCITYNQSKYISQCIDSFIMQKCDFDIEVLIHDDCSTDGTKEIIEEYAKKYPNIIKPFFEEENQYTKGNIIKVIKNLYSRCIGKYIAICEGDDYWCDPYKLQKQVDFLGKNPDYALCYHPAKMIYQNEEHEPVIIGLSEYKNPQPYYELIKANNIPANSVMYRTEYLKQELLNYPENIYPPDWFTHISVAKHGKIGYLPDVMYVYRWHSNGISHTTSNNPVEEIHLKYGVKEVNFSYAVYNKIKDQFPQYYKEVFINVLRDVYISYMKNSKLKELEILQQNYSQYFKDIEFNMGLDEINRYKKKYKKYKKLFNIFLFISIILFCISLILLLAMKN